MDFDERKRDDLVFLSAFSNIKTIVEDQIAEGDKVATRITMLCNHTERIKMFLQRENRLQSPYRHLLLKAGKIVEGEWVEFDMMSILRQITQR